jgi:hypothetical protein
VLEECVFSVSSWNNVVAAVGATTTVVNHDYDQGHASSRGTMERLRHQ